ncbi:Methylated-DNA/protein-cysteine methyltransferase [Rhodococcus sp. AW25M09]|uniref:methylated-DNA--[protein]-cysteine S-methyltransferase n=1 Tax=Rhodococcus sp. AW25M09 TaxID=1268303 RepID=UPI0002AC99C7|nr:methylated-DNA--[protein]-cysteine S-methyltransferase [Rhodococcus sp. AW25M09]CCQ14928.1 Methylated-DNA/protein-cysteine methyltransferase [Rhodococcus sp. AW25M09]
MPSYTLFDTAIGRCGLAWTEDGVIAVALPEPSDEAMMEYLAGFGAAEGPVDNLGRFAGSTPDLAADAIDRISGLLDGRAVDMSPIPLVLDVSEFDASVYTGCSAIPRGATLTYGEIARRLGHPGAAQAVGGALGRNPVPIIVPCHRVLGAGTEVGGFSAPGGANTKQRILGIEGVPGFDEPTLF